ncbi:restriction endonuclease subunit S [Agathobaculum sp. LCP25S3_E8]|uniref:restriction endonuclease subunit S n=1 Tax=Agathobaculum sp. LCP25S3_E8 TaxID=3438735 RepID=UPI003F8F1FA8
MARFEDVLTIINGKNQKKVENENGQYPIYGSGGIMGYADDYICEANTVVIGRKGSINNPIFIETRFWNVDTAFGLYANPAKLQPKYLYYFCEKFDFEQLNTTVTIPSLTKANLLKVEIPLPPLDEQREIAAVLDKVSDLIAKRHQQLDRLGELVKSRFVEMFGDILYDTNLPLIQLNELADIGSSKRIYANEYVELGVPFYRSKEIRELGSGLKPSVELFIKQERYDEIKDKYGVPKIGDILIAAIGATIGYSWIVDTENPFYYKDGNLILLSIKDNVNPIFLNHALGILIENFKNKGVAGSAQLALTIEKLEKMMVVNPDIKLQEQFANFVTQIDKSKLAIQKSLEQLETLKKALMQEYFG